MRYAAIRRIPQARPEPVFRRLAVGAASCVLLGLLLAFASSSPLPDSARPCAPCHHGDESNQVGEWLASPYSEMKGGMGCVDCHDGRCRGNDGAISRDPYPAARFRNLREVVRLAVAANCDGEAVNVEVAVSNVGAGHSLPTGSRERTLILDVSARDLDGATVLWQAGSRHLQLPPFATAVSRYRILSLRNGPVHVAARLVLESGNDESLELAEATSVCSPIGG